VPDLQTPEKIHQLPVTIIRNMIALSTSGFGLVVALAWNSVIQKFVEEVISPYLGKSSGLFSLGVYAIVVTIFAVLITMQLARLQRHLEVVEKATEKTI